MKTLNTLTRSWLPGATKTLAAAAILCGVSSAPAANITLTSAFQPGDYFVAATPSNANGPNAFFQVRPTNPAATQVVYNSGGLADDSSLGGAFNHANGDFFYWSGSDANHKGYELRKIAAGQTTSTLVIADMAHANTQSINAVAVASDNTVYALQTDGKVRKFNPTGINTYDAGTTLANAPAGGSSFAGATMRIINQGALMDDYLLVATVTSPGIVASVNTSTGVATTVAGALNTGAFNRAQSLAVDYNHPFGDGKLRVLVTNVSAMTTTEGTTPQIRRITELAFDPVTGALSNPFSGGTGNVPGDAFANSVVMGNTDQPLDAVQFDNDGNLVFVTRHQAQYGYSYTPGQLYPESNTFNFTSGTTAWDKSSVSGSPSFNAVRSLDIAPIPEPATLGLLALGGLLLVGGRK
ncbi:MAG: PEP-CTERM sorting domain-containing protein [Phycisphaerales bacterium]